MHFSKNLCAAICVCVFMMTGAAFATDYDVTCPGDSVQNKINTIKATLPNGPNKITITGTCAEGVLIESLKNLTIQAKTLGVDGLKPPSGPVAAVFVQDSYNITLWGLVLEGAGSSPGGVYVFGSQQVQAQSLTIKKGDMGIVCSQNSFCMVNASAGTTTISDMYRQGISVAASSMLNLGGVNDSTITIQNTGGGIIVGGNSQLYVTGTWSVVDTKGGNEGVTVIGSTFGFRGGTGGGTIRNTGVGIHVTDNGSFTYGNPLTIENNKQAVIARYGAALHIGGAPGNLVIQNNADTANPKRPGGVSVQDGAVASLSNATITGNQVAGVYTRNNAMVSLIANTITGNLGDGVLSTQRSAVWLLEREDPSTIKNNTGKDLVCTVQGTAYGDNSGVGKMACKDFEKIN